MGAKYGFLFCVLHTTHTDSTETKSLLSSRKSQTKFFVLKFESSWSSELRFIEKP